MPIDPNEQDQGRDRDLRDTVPDIELDPDEQVKPSHNREEDEEDMAEDDLQIDLDELPEAEGPDA